MPLDKRKKAQVLKDNIQDTFMNCTFSMCNVDKGVYPRHGGRRVLAKVEFPEVVINFEKQEFNEYTSAIILTDSAFVEGYYICKRFITLAVGGIVFEANGLFLIGEMIFTDSNTRKPVEIYILYNNISLKKVWFLSEFNKEKLSWLSAFGCEVLNTGTVSAVDSLEDEDEERVLVL